VIIFANPLIRREDFYYRINVISLDIPPLRERLEDVPVLADHFLKHYVEETGKTIEGYTRGAIDMLTAYHWPGNVRELRNVIERAVVLAKGRMYSVNHSWVEGWPSFPFIASRMNVRSVLSAGQPKSVSMKSGICLGSATAGQPAA
jgi:DNA-binding NtrC family response regulator